MASTLTEYDWCQINSRAIEGMYETLARDIDCTKYFPSLRSAFVLTADDCDEIRHQGTRKKMVEKFLDILGAKKKRNVVEELLNAIRKDKTMPALHTKLMQMFLEEKERYKGETNKREASPPQQRRSYEPYSMAGANDDDQGPLPPPPPNSSPSPHSLHNLPSSSYSYTSSGQTAVDSSIDQQAMLSSISSTSSSFSSNPMPGAPPSSHRKKAPFATSSSVDNFPPRPQTQESSRPGGPVAPNPTYILTENVRNSYSNESYPNEHRDTESSIDSDVRPNTPPPLTDISKVGSSVQEFSRTAQHGSTMHDIGSTDSNSDMKLSIPPVSGGGDPAWSETHQSDVLNKLKTN